MIRLLDRYVLSIFLPALAMFTLAFIGLFLAVDFASKLGRFLELKDVSLISFVAEYYLLRIPMMLTFLLPCVLLFAPIFTVVKLSRTNEILPVAASGISLRRLSLPFLIAAFVGGLVMAAMDEFVLARIGGRITDTEEILSARGISHSVEAYDGYTKLWARRYDVLQKELTDAVRVTVLDEEARTVRIINAARARWHGGSRRWIAHDGVVEFPMELIHREGEKPQTRRDPIPAEGLVLDAPFTPDSLRKSTSFTSRFPFATFKKLLEDLRRYPHVPSNRLKIHNRFSFPLSPLILVLIGLPFVVAAHGKSMAKGLFFCFLLCVGYYLAYFAFTDLGNRGTVDPLAGAWGPTTAFGLFGLGAFYRMRT
jgi:lipopolysaccharide export system permease protein